jgi:putative ABC transport system ATP-binding protein
VIEAREVHKTYDTGSIQVHALRGVSLEVRRGEMVAIMGPSGCGKTTLLNCLSGLDDFDSGTVLINGTDITRMADDRKTEFRAKDMGFVFQTYNLLPVLSAAERHRRMLRSTARWWQGQRDECSTVAGTRS